MHLTRTQAKIMNLLADGLPHTREEVFACLVDELTALTTISTHIYNLRLKLRHRGHDIIARKVNGRWSYQQVRLIAG